MNAEKMKARKKYIKLVHNKKQIDIEAIKTVKINSNKILTKSNSFKKWASIY